MTEQGQDTVGLTSILDQGQFSSRCCSDASIKNSFLVLPFWYLLTRVVPDKFQKSSKMVVCLLLLLLLLFIIAVVMVVVMLVVCIV